MSSKDIIYFSVNNWGPGKFHPDTEIFRKWLGEDEDQYFMNDEWCKENKLCVYCGIIDMSYNYTVSAPKEWVEKNCPELLTNYSDFIFLPKEGEIKPESVVEEKAEVKPEPVVEEKAEAKPEPAVKKETAAKSKPAAKRKSRRARKAKK